MQEKSNLSALRGKNRYSINEVHEKMGLARGTISNLYNDKVTRIDFETIRELCVLFDCDISAMPSFHNAEETLNKDLEEQNDERAKEQN